MDDYSNCLEQFLKAVKKHEEEEEEEEEDDEEEEEEEEEDRLQQLTNSLLKRGLEKSKKLCSDGKLLVYYKCCICECAAEGFGSNALPYKEGDCCNDCNMTFVIPSRIAALKMQEEEEEEKKKKKRNKKKNKKSFKEMTEEATEDGRRRREEEEEEEEEEQEEQEK